MGQGFDAHRLAEGDGIWLGGVHIDCGLRVQAHSDGDLLLHALCDALLGALALGDIGQHFPPSDDRWRDAASSDFVLHAVQLCTARGYRCGNADLTLIGERPKLGPHREAIRESVARLLRTEPEAVSIKATTTEGMGFTGRGEGLAAMAVVLLQGGH